jgi:hypothetical protein
LTLTEIDSKCFWDNAIDYLTAPLLEKNPSGILKSGQALKSAKNGQVFPFAMSNPVSKVRKGSQDPKALAEHITYEELVKNFETMPQLYKQENLFGNLGRSLNFIHESMGKLFNKDFFSCSNHFF